MLVNCSFKLKEGYFYEDIPVDIFTALAEVGFLLNTVEPMYSISSSISVAFSLTCWDMYMPIYEDLLELIEAHKLDDRHLRAFCWLKRHTDYTGDSHNVNDWDMHPFDFFEDIEDIIRTARKNRS